MTETTHKVTLTNAEGYKTEVTSRGHRILSDEPKESSGTDTGMNPYELLLSAVGACKAITMRMYAQRKGLPLEDVKLELTHRKVSAEEVENARTTSGKIDVIDIKVEVKGDLSEEQKARIAEIGERCPVQKTLLSEVVIHSVRVESILL